LLSHDIPASEHSWIGIIATFPDYALVCHEYMDMDKEVYYKVLWKMEGDEPEFFGVPKEVEIKQRTEVQELKKNYDPLSSKPFPNEHAIRLNDPKKYKKIRRQNDKFGDGIHAIFGVKEDDKTELQAIRFSADKFTADEAKSWLSEHDYGTSGFEAATGKEAEETDGKSTKKELTIKEAMAFVVAHASADERKQVVKWFEFFDQIEKENQLADDYRAITGT
jgi:arsenate reductase-like glutaredoxin family protein